MLVNKKILIVDDEPDIVSVLSMRLKAQNYLISTASNGQEALAQVAKEVPDLIVLDILMPVMDGFDCFKALRKTPEYKNIPVVMLTARGQMRGTFEALDVDAFLAKPFDPAELVETVRSLLVSRALVLCDDPYITEKVQTALEKRGYELVIVKTEEAFFEKGKDSKYRVVVVYLACVRKTPEEFMASLSMMKARDPLLIVYSDSKVKGTEDNYNVAIADIASKWKRAGLKIFFDPRATERTFTDLIGGSGK